MNCHFYFQFNDKDTCSFSGEERLNRMVDEIRLLEAEKRDNSVLAEREKVAELEANIESLKRVSLLYGNILNKYSCNYFKKLLFSRKTKVIFSVNVRTYVFRI